MQLRAKHVEMSESVVEDLLWSRARTEDEVKRSQDQNFNGKHKLR